MGDERRRRERGCACRLPGAALPVVITVAPNQEWAIREGSPPALVRYVPFVRPFG
jgi:hypothetical protein